MEELRYIYKIKYYSAIKRNNLLTPTTVWMNVKNIMVHERSQAQKKRQAKLIYGERNQSSGFLEGQEEFNWERTQVNFSEW